MSETQPLIPSNQLSTRKFLLLLLSLYFGVFIAAVDSTVTSTLVPAIASDLKALDNISWVSTAYLVAYSAFQPLYGKLSDIYGRKHVLLTTTFIFGLGCYICTVGSTIVPVIIGRVLNGVGAGGMLSLSSITVSDYVPSRKRGVYQGFGNIAFGVGAASGGIIGSAAQAYKGWRYAFTIQVPLAFVSFLIVSWIMTEKKASSSEVVPENGVDHIVYRTSFERVDVTGSVALASSVALFMVAVTTGGNIWPWKSIQILAFFLLSSICFGFFYRWEKYHAVEPVLPIWLMADRTVLSTCLTNFFSSGICYTIYVYMPIYFTAQFDYTATNISRLLVVNFFGVSTGSLLTGYIMQKTGKYYVLGVMANIGVLMSVVVFSSLPFVPYKLASCFWYQALAFILLGFSFASMLTVSLVCLIAAQPKHQATATSAQYTFRGVGSSVGVALAAAAFNRTLVLSLKENITGKHAKQIIKKVSKSVGAINEIPVKYKPAVLLSYRSATIAVLALSAGMAVLAIVSSSMSREHKLDGDAEE